MNKKLIIAGLAVALLLLSVPMVFAATDKSPKANGFQPGAGCGLNAPACINGGGCGRGGVGNGATPAPQSYNNL